jgi:hypothetical protein
VGKSAIEVVSAIVEHLTRDASGVDGEVLRNALQETILEAAGLEAELGYRDLETGLQNFLAQAGVDGLIELFLCHYVFDAVWVAIEDYAQSRSNSEQSFEAFMSAIEEVCRDEVRAAVAEYREDGKFGQVDWFGADGRRIGDDLSAEIVGRLRTPG